MVFPFLIGAAAGRIKAEFLSICESSGSGHHCVFFRADFGSSLRFGVNSTLGDGRKALCGEM